MLLANALKERESKCTGNYLDVVSSDKKYWGECKPINIYILNIKIFIFIHVTQIKYHQTTNMGENVNQ